MLAIKLSKLVNQNLIRDFDQSRVRYMVFVFPTYQILSITSLLTITFLFQTLGISLYFIPLGLILVILLGVPILASWHLSCLLFGVGYFSFLAKLGFPFMSWVTNQLENAVSWFRVAQ